MTINVSLSNNWQAIRKQVLVRDGYTCQQCDKMLMI